MQRVLVVSNDVIGARMAGTGIRASELARAMAGWDGGRALEVTLAVAPHVPRPAGEPPHLGAVPLIWPDEAGLRAAAAAADVVFAQGFVVLRYPWLSDVSRFLALDIYAPFMLEGLEEHAALPPDQRWHLHEQFLSAMTSQLRVGDFFVCASEKQRDLYLGMLTALGRVNPATHDADPSLRQLLAVVPFGLPSEPLVHRRQVLKGVRPGIGPNDRVILWLGGIWNWFDPATLLHAMTHVIERHPEARLFFLGTRHPNPNMPAALGERVSPTEALAAELGLLDRCVFFSDWVDYSDRVNYLCEADLMAMIYGEHLETRFAYRTRMLDTIYAGLPTVCTRGDTLADLVETRGLGYSAAPGDVAGVAEGLIRLLDEPDAKGARARQFRELAESLRWDRVVAPLAAFCADPRRAPDRERPHAAGAARPAPAPPQPEPTPVWELPGRALTLLARQGPAGLARELRSYVRWRTNRI